MNKYKIKTSEGEEEVYANSEMELKTMYETMGIPVQVLGEVEHLRTSTDSVQDHVRPLFDNQTTAVNGNPVPSGPMLPPTPAAPQPPKEIKFSAGGFEFKVINGEVYMKSWIDLTSDEYQLISNKSNKVIENNSYKVQVKDWVKCDTEAKT